MRTFRVNLNEFMSDFIKKKMIQKHKLNRIFFLSFKNSLVLKKKKQETNNWFTETILEKWKKELSGYWKTKFYFIFKYITVNTKSWSLCLWKFQLIENNWLAFLNEFISIIVVVMIRIFSAVTANILVDWFGDWFSDWFGDIFGNVFITLTSSASTISMSHMHDGCYQKEYEDGEFHCFSIYWNWTLQEKSKHW